jgi:hypothetical protein
MGGVARKPENFACKDAQKRHCLAKSSLASFGVSLRALSGASCDASEEVLVFHPRRCLEMAQAIRKTRMVKKNVVVFRMQV